MSVDAAASAMALFSLVLLSILIVRVITSIFANNLDPCASCVVLVLFIGLLVGVVFLFLVIVECQTSANPPAVCS